MNLALARRLRAGFTLALLLVLAGCQSLTSLPEQARQAPAEAVDPAYLQYFEKIQAALAEPQLAEVPTDPRAYAERARRLQAIGAAFHGLRQSGPATTQEFPLWGQYFNRLSDTVEAVVAGDANLAEAERLYDLAAGLYPQFIERSNLPERPYVAVDGETSAYYAGNYFLCTMPEVLADQYGRQGEAGMSQHLERAMDRYLTGPCEPDLMFSAAEMLYDYALISGPNRSIYRSRIEQAGPGESAPWLILLDNLLSNHDQTLALSKLDQALAEARANLDSDDVVSEEFASEVERQRTLLMDGRRPIRTLGYQP